MRLSGCHMLLMKWKGRWFHLVFGGRRTGLRAPCRCSQARKEASVGLVIKHLHSLSLSPIQQHLRFIFWEGVPILVGGFRAVCWGLAFTSPPPPNERPGTIFGTFEVCSTAVTPSVFGAPVTGFLPRPASRASILSLRAWTSSVFSSS